MTDDTNPPFPLTTDQIAALRPLAGLGEPVYRLHLMARRVDGLWFGMWCQRDDDGAFCADPVLHGTREMPWEPTHFVAGA